jgi:hypothetical protein
MYLSWWEKPRYVTALRMIVCRAIAFICGLAFGYLWHFMQVN